MIPDYLFCSRRNVDVSPSTFCSPTAGVLILQLTPLPVSTHNALASAPASIVYGVRPPSISSIENLFWPPLEVSFAAICQSFGGNDAEFAVSCNLIRRLFSSKRNGSKPKLSPLNQSNPSLILPSTIRSSRIIWSAHAPVATTIVPTDASVARVGPALIAIIFLLCHRDLPQLSALRAFGKLRAFLLLYSMRLAAGLFRFTFVSRLKIAPLINRKSPPKITPISNAGVAVPLQTLSTFALTWTAVYHQIRRQVFS